MVVTWHRRLISSGEVPPILQVFHLSISIVLCRVFITTYMPQQKIFIFGIVAHLDHIWAKFEHQGYWVKVKLHLIKWEIPTESSHVKDILKSR